MPRMCTMPTKMMVSCPVCSKAFSSTSTRNRHMRRFHTSAPNEVAPSGEEEEEVTPSEVFEEAPSEAPSEASADEMETDDSENGSDDSENGSAFTDFSHGHIAAFYLCSLPSPRAPSPSGVLEGS